MTLEEELSYLIESYEEGLKERKSPTEIVEATFRFSESLKGAIGSGEVKKEEAVRMLKRLLKSVSAYQRMMKDRPQPADRNSQREIEDQRRIAHLFRELFELLYGLGKLGSSRKKEVPKKPDRISRAGKQRQRAQRRGWIPL